MELILFWVYSFWVFWLGLILLLLSIVHGKWSAFVFGKKLKLEEESMVEKRNRIVFIHDWLKEGTNMEVINMFTTCVILAMLISSQMFFFFFFFFYDLIDNSNLAKIGILLSSCWLVYCWLLFFNEKGATHFCLKFSLWFYISESDLPIGSHSILYLIDLIFSPVLIGSCDWFNIIIVWIGELNIYLA